jgi:hypothetical protein
MTTDLVPYVGSSLIIILGIAHVFLTRRIVQGYESISADNRRIITMSWATQGFTLIFIGLLLMFVRYLYQGCPLTYPASALMFLVMAAWTALTGGRTKVTFLRISPIVETIVAIMFVYSELLLLHLI